MEKGCVSLRTLIRSFMVNFIMDNLKDKVNSILQQEIIMLANLNLIKNKVEEDTIGQESSRTFIKDNSRQVKEMGGEHFGGPMAAGMKVNSKMEYKAAMDYFIDMGDKLSMKGSGIMECLTERELNILTMEKDMKDNSKKINSMAMVCSTKMTQLFMEFGRITNFQL